MNSNEESYAVYCSKTGKPAKRGFNSHGNFTPYGVRVVLDNPKLHPLTALELVVGRNRINPDKLLPKYLEGGVNNA